MMATSSTDGAVKIWDISANGGTNPELISQRSMKQGELFTLQFCQDIPWVLACGGSKGEVAVWDVSENNQIENHFKNFLIKGSYDENDYNINDADAQHNNDYQSMSDSEEEAKKEKKKKKKKTLKV